MSHFNNQEKEIAGTADLKLFKALWPFIKPYLWMLILTTLMVFVVTGFELAMPILIQKAFDNFIIPVNQIKGATILGFSIVSFKIYCLVFLALILTAFCIDFVQSLFMEYTGQKIIFNLRCKFFSHMTLLPVAFYDKNSSGRLVSRVTNDIENMNEMFTSVLIFIFRDLMLMVGILGMLFFLDIKLALYLLCLVPIIITSIVLFSKVLRKTFRTIRQKIGEINHSFSEAITGIKIIQTTSSQNIFIQRFKNLNFEHFKAALFQIKMFSIFMPFIGFLSSVSVAMVIWAGSFEVIEKSMTIGGLIAFLSYMKLFFRPLRDLSEKFNLLQSALASAERVVAILNNEKARTVFTNNQIDHKGEITTIKKIDIDKITSLKFEKLDFSYKKNEQILNNISFSLDQDKSIGIAGETGSGKSSIINLITGFYQPDKGHILVNNLKHSAMDIKDIRNKIALVMQDPFLVSGTIKDNIQPSRLDMDNKELEKALYNANCNFLFEKFSGLDTLIEEGGRPLSSGEKQLVCIARAFAFNPDLIIFDEATSYMDSQSEQKIHDAMKNLMKGRLAIIIAHRLSTIRNCDTILLLKDGTIKERGSHQELVKSKGEYYHLLQKERI
jgi:ATP-binding cassette, subfamily B, multidrug efflux pump